jgi:hypothetical protein
MAVTAIMQFKKKKKIQISIFLEIRPVGAELFLEDGQTDRHDGTNSRLSQLCETFILIETYNYFKPSNLCL